jgi:hypothetical protein
LELVEKFIQEIDWPGGNMSVQIVENWTRISGLISALWPADDVQGFIQIEVAVEKAESVQGFPNLLEQAKDTLLPVHVPDELVDEYAIQPNAFIMCWVRLAGHGRTFVHREHIQVMPPGEK